MNSLKASGRCASRSGIGHIERADEAHAEGLDVVASGLGDRAELAGLQGAKRLAVDQRRGVDLAGGQRAGQVRRLDLDLLEIAAFERGIESVLLDQRQTHLGVAGRAQRIGAERLALELLRVLDRRIALDPDAGAFAAGDCCSAVDSTFSSRPRAAAGGIAITAVMITSYCLAEVAWISCGIASPRASTSIRSELTLPLLIAQVTAS